VLPAPAAGRVAGSAWRCCHHTHVASSRCPDPLLDLSLFGNRAFSAALAANTLDFFVSFAALLFIAQYLQLVVGSRLTPLLVRRARPAYVMAAGMALAAIGFALLTRLDAAAGLAVLVTGSVAFSLGSAPMTTLATDLMVGTAPPQRAGAASAISETSSELGGRWASRSSGASAALSTVARWPTPFRPGPTPGGESGARHPRRARWRWPSSSPTSLAARWWRWLARRSPTGCN